MPNPGERQAIELMARYGTTNLDEAVAREMVEAGVRGFSKDEILQSVIDEERSKLMGGKIPGGTCMEEGCGKPRREGKARCDEHQKALQNATYQRTKGKKAAHHKEAKKAEAVKEPAKLETPAAPIHLCDTCVKEFASCVSSPEFGNGKGNDNVVKCGEFAEEKSADPRPAPAEYQPPIETTKTVTMSPDQLVDFAHNVHKLEEQAAIAFVHGFLWGRRVA